MNDGTLHFGGNSGGGEDRNPFPKGLRLIAWNDLWHAPPGFQQPTKPRLQVVAKPTDIANWPDNTRDLVATKPGSPSVHEKAGYYQLLEPTLGDYWDRLLFWVKAEGPWRLEWILGGVAQINVSHEKRDEKTFANIQAVIPATDSKPSWAVVAARLYHYSPEIYTRIYGKEKAEGASQLPFLDVPRYAPQLVDKWGQSALFKTGDLMPHVEAPAREPVAAGAIASKDELAPWEATAKPKGFDDELGF